MIDDDLYDDDDSETLSPSAAAYHTIDHILAMDALTIELRRILYRCAAEQHIDIRRRRYDQLRRQAGLFDDDVVELHYLADALGVVAPTTYRYDIVAGIDAALNSAAAADDARWAAVRRRPGR